MSSSATPDRFTRARLTGGTVAAMPIPRRKNGKPAITGTCPKCGNKVFRIGG